MRRTDDVELSDEDIDPIRLHADALLRKAGVQGVLPTPVDRLVHAAGLRVESRFFTEDDILSRMESAPAEFVKRARRDLLGVVDVIEKIIYVRQDILTLDLPPLILHEAAHALLEWQSPLYLYVQEDESPSLTAYTRDRFESEANQFAWELIFQGKRFQREAADCHFSLETPVKLAVRYGTTIYAAICRFVKTNAEPCALLIDSLTPKGWRSRRPIQSVEFTKRFGTLPCSEVVRLSGPGFPPTGYDARHPFSLSDLNRNSIECETQSLITKNHSFTLVYPVNLITKVPFAWLSRQST